MLVINLHCIFFQVQMNMMFPAYLLLSLDILLATLVVELISIGLALYLLSVSIYRMVYVMKRIILSFLYALLLKRVFWFDMVTVESAYYTWSRAHLSILRMDFSQMKLFGLA